MTDSDQAYCYLTTTGRVSGLRRTIEIWFALVRDEGSPSTRPSTGSGGASGGLATAYLLAGSGEAAQWVRNLRREPRVSISIGEREYEARARVVEDPAEDARGLP